MQKFVLLAAAFAAVAIGAVGGKGVPLQCEIDVPGDYKKFVPPVTQEI